MRKKIAISNLLLALILFTGSFYNVYANKEKSLIQEIVEKTNVISEIPINEVAPKMYVTLIDEQKRIVEFLDEECEKIERLIASKELLIKKLTDYKKSLIYEVVTGKKEV